jgi:HlyD family type I secretion membrane fusion protein
MNSDARQSRRAREVYANPWRPARMGFAVIAGFALLLGTWSVAAPLSGAVVANGSLQVEGRRQHVQHPYGGVVSKINAREAQQVKRGDILITLSDTQPRARYNVLKQNQLALLAEKARLIAERDGANKPDFAALMQVEADRDAAAEFIRNEESVLASRNQQYAARLDVGHQQIVQLREQSGGVKSQLEGLTRQAELLAEQMVGLRKLAKSKIASRNQVMALESRQSEANSAIASRRAELASISAKIAEAKLRITELKRERISEATASLQDADAKLAELGPNLETAMDVLERSQIRAPATGTVVGLKVYTEGGVIEAGASLMEIVPSDSPLFAEARLRLSDISDVKPGQIVDVRLSGVPREIRPKITGTVRSVSADSLSDQATGAGYYALQVQLDRQDLERAKIALQPGMPVQAIIETQPRTLAEYLAGPLIDEVSGAFRER